MLPGNVQRMFFDREGKLQPEGKRNLKTLNARTTIKTFCIFICGVKLWNGFPVGLQHRALFSPKNTSETCFWKGMKLMTDKYVSSETI